MSNLWQQINYDLKQAMRDRDKDRVAVLRMLLAALKNKIIEIGPSTEKDLPNEISIQVIKSEIKKRKDAIVSYEQAGRQELADIEKKEIEELNNYMPPMMSQEEVESTVRKVVEEMGEVGMSDFGQVMGQAMKKLKGLADGEIVGQSVKKILQK